MRISDWSSDVCSSDLVELARNRVLFQDGLAHRPVHLLLRLCFELEAELSKDFDQRREIRGPLESCIGLPQQKIEILRETREYMQDAKTRVALEKRDIEKNRPEERSVGQEGVSTEK